MIVAVDQNIPFIRGVLEQFAEVRYMPGSGFTRSSVHDAHALIIRTRTRCDAALLKGTAVRFIASATIGFDHIDTAYCKEAGIVWKNAPGCNSSSVQQYLAAALYALADRIGPLAGKTIGVIGVGNVGTKVAAFCSLLGMTVLLNDPPRERKEGKHGFVPVAEIMNEADIITLHVPLNREGDDRTIHLVDDDFIGRLKPHQILINTSRGEVVQTGALRKGLEKKRLAAAVLDVWEQEPAIDTKLLGSVTIGTPHIAGYSADGKANGTAMSIRSLSKHFGLGIDDWFPPKILHPARTEYDLDCRSLTPEQVLGRAVKLTYDISADDRRLKASPATFEKQRSEYPLRREFPAYSLRLRNAKRKVIDVCTSAGFHCISTSEG